VVGVVLGMMDQEVKGAGIAAAEPVTDKQNPR